jgi:hypothetical protein
MKLGDRRRVVLAASIPLVAALLCYLLVLYNFPETIVKYRLSATFSLDGTTSTGSGVLQVRYQPQLCFDVCGIAADLAGDAIPIDFPNDKGTLWILLRPSSTLSSKQTANHNDPAWLVPDIFGRYDGRKSRAALVRQIRRFQGTRQLTFDQLPQLIMLPNDNIPAVPWKNATTPLQAGDLRPEFVDAQIEITEAPITRGIGSRLPWLNVTPDHSGPLYRDGSGGPGRDEFRR